MEESQEAQSSCNASENARAKEQTQNDAPMKSSFKTNNPKVIGRLQFGSDEINMVSPLASLNRTTSVKEETKKNIYPKQSSETPGNLMSKSFSKLRQFIDEGEDNEEDSNAEITPSPDYLLSSSVLPKVVKEPNAPKVASISLGSMGSSTRGGMTNSIILSEPFSVKIQKFKIVILAIAVNVALLFCIYNLDRDGIILQIKPHDM